MSLKNAFFPNWTSRARRISSTRSLANLTANDSCVRRRNGAHIRCDACTETSTNFFEVENERFACCLAKFTFLTKRRKGSRTWKLVSKLFEGKRRIWKDLEKKRRNSSKFLNRTRSRAKICSFRCSIVQLCYSHRVYANKRTRTCWNFLRKCDYAVSRGLRASYSMTLRNEGDGDRIWNPFGIKINSSPTCGISKDQTQMH